MTATSPPLTRRLLTAARELRHLPRVLRLVWRAAGWVTPLWLALLIIAGLLPAVSVLLIRIAVDGLVAIVGDPATAADPWTRLQPVLPALIGVAAVLLTIEVSSAVARWLRTVQAERVTDHVAAAIHTQAARLDLAVYDDPSYFDRLHRARLYAHDRPTQVLEQLGTALQSLLTLFAMVVVLVPFGWWLPALLIVGTAPTLLLVIGHQIRAYHFRHRTTTRERRIGYYDWLLTAAEPAAELRLFALKDRLRARWRQLRDGLRSERLTLAAAEARAEVLAGLLALGALGGGMLWMVRELVRGAVSLGDVALFYQALDHSQRALRALLTTLAEIYGSVLDLGDFFAYLELEPSIDDPATPVALEPEAPRQAIRFHDVGFTYPGSREPVLQRLDLDLPAARTTALVGPNGSGKSTIIKLLCRLYDPDHGRIDIDGVDLRRLRLADVRRRIAVLMQEPMRYDETARDNVAFGAEGDLTPEALDRIARGAGADEVVASLPEGWDSRLGRFFVDAGAELSVGQWQRLALARALARGARVVLLDEPTSALDAWAEVGWPLRLREAAGDSTIVLITHRFTTAMHADRIHVFDRDGRVVESGNHAELLAADGTYARSWRAQTGIA